VGTEHGRTRTRPQPGRNEGSRHQSNWVRSLSGSHQKGRKTQRREGVRTVPVTPCVCVCLDRIIQYCREVRVCMVESKSVKSFWPWDDTPTDRPSSSAYLPAALITNMCTGQYSTAPHLRESRLYVCTDLHPRTSTLHLIIILAVVQIEHCTAKGIT